MGEKYNPKSKGSPTSWKTVQRKLPRALSTFQVMIMAGFLSLLLMRSSIGIASRNFASLYTTVADDEYAKEEQSRLQTDVKDAEPKRNLVQTADPGVKLNTQIEEQHLDEVRWAMAGKTVKDVTEEEQPRKPVEAAAAAAEKKPVATTTVKGVKNIEDRTAAEKEKAVVAKPKELVEDFQQVEAQLGEEETADELAEFEKFQKGQKEETVSSSTEQQPTKAAEQVLVQPVDRPTPKKEKPVETKTTEIETSVSEQTSEKVSVETQKSEEHESVEEQVEEAKSEESERIQPRKLTPEELKALTEDAIANMSKITRRGDSNAFSLGLKISDWDEQRAAWLQKNPEKKSADPHRPNVLLLSGSQPSPCKSPIGDHYLLKMIKNKVDYARIHKLETFYSFAHLDKPMSHLWAKMPLIRKMMLMRPDVEWFFWMDSDAMFTDMVFEIPFEKYRDANLVLWGSPEGIYDERSWVGCNTGVMFLRNNQWTLDLLDLWSQMGPEGEIRNGAGQILTSYLTNRPVMQADDQSALVFLLLTMPELRAKIVLEDEYLLSGFWIDLVDRYEEFSEKSRPGAGGKNWPFTTHFTGCQRCSGESNQQYEGKSCLDGMERAFNFADNQVLRPFGFEHENLLGTNVLRIRNESTKPILSVPVHNPWAVESFYT